MFFAGNKTPEEVQQLLIADEKHMREVDRLALLYSQEKEHRLRVSKAREFYKNVNTARAQEKFDLDSRIFLAKLANSIAPLWKWIPGGELQYAKNRELIAGYSNALAHIRRSYGERLTSRSDEVALRRFIETHPEEFPKL